MATLSIISVTPTKHSLRSASGRRCFWETSSSARGYFLSFSRSFTSLRASPDDDELGPALSRNSFGQSFTFGTASSAYQYEGAHNLDDKQPSNWDAFTRGYPEKIKGSTNGDVAISHYHLYSEDLAHAKSIGFDAFRFSISWSRVMNYGKLNRGVNRKGVQYYNKYIDELIAKGLEPYGTLFHFDVPQYLENEYGGFLDRRIISDFQEYAELCFTEFGDRVKHWITINEPYIFTNNGYNIGTFAPGRCSKNIGNCNSGDSATEPYIVSHNVLLAHAAAVNVYKEKYQVYQKGVIGITLCTYWFEPYTEQKNDVDAAQRAQDFMFGWHMDPLTFGDYPQSMKQLVGKRLPTFTKSESDMLKGSYDFLGLNYYTAIYAMNLENSNDILPSYGTDSHVTVTPYRNGIPIGPHEAPDWMYVYPKGILDILIYVKHKYENPPIYITENGIAQAYVNKVPLAQHLDDNVRIKYHSHHLEFLLKAIKEGVDVRGYFAWSLLDNFEWNDGYTVGFGFIYVDIKTMRRQPKKSYFWFKKFLHVY